MSNLVQKLDKFLKTHYRPPCPVILGFSGGPDSSALLHCFWKLQRKYCLEVVVLHVDHGWREESAREAKRLQEYVSGLGLEFHLETLKADLNDSNLEEEARLARLKIFKKYFVEMSAQAVIFAHQAQDQSETVLKRLFEGSHLITLGAMKKVSALEGMTIWRPFLEIPKEELIAHCKASGVSYLMDSTNEDERFLRARMRKRLVPLLEEHFGKGIQGNLARFSEMVHEMSDYFTNQIGQKGQDLSAMDPFVAKLALKELGEKKSLKLGKKHLDELYQILLKKDGVVRKFMIGGNSFVICNGNVNLT
jgi:tRNA(Ile)-lysidine synthase